RSIPANTIHFRYNVCSPTASMTQHFMVIRRSTILCWRRIMLFPLKRTLWSFLCLAIVLPVSASQMLAGQQAAKSGNANASANEAPPDPLGRNTPSGTLYGFLEAAQSQNYSTAAQYLQMSAARRQAQGEDIASKLKVVIDRSFSGDLRQIS